MPSLDGGGKLYTWVVPGRAARVRVILLTPPYHHMHAPKAIAIAQRSEYQSAARPLQCAGAMPPCNAGTYLLPARACVRLEAALGEEPATISGHTS